MTELEAINQIRALLGLPAISSAQIQNSSIASIRDSLNRARLKALRDAPQKFGYEVTLLPSGGSIAISQFLRVIYPKHLENRLTERNGIVWDKENNEAYSQALTVIAVDEVAFEQIDSYAWQYYIALEAAAEMSMRTNDVDQNYAVIRQQASRAKKKAYNEAKISRVGFLGSDSAMRGYFS